MVLLEQVMKSGKPLQNSISQSELSLFTAWNTLVMQCPLLVLQNVMNTGFRDTTFTGTLTY
jgi:hypothetical protein